MEAFIKKCQEAYEQGRSIISDEQYDYLVSVHPDSEKVIGKRGDTPHYKRMYSLQKYYIGKDKEVVTESITYYRNLSSLRKAFNIKKFGEPVRGDY